MLLVFSAKVFISPSDAMPSVETIVPSSDGVQKLAQALDTTTDYLMNGDHDEAVAAQLTDRELLKQFKEVEMLSPEDKHLVKTFIDAFLTKRHIQELAK